MSVTAPTTPDDMLEASVLMNEQALEARAEQQSDVRHQVYLNINGELVPVIDQPDEVKFAVATDAVNKRAEQYEKEAYKVAEFKLKNMSEVEAVDHIASLAAGDKEIYLRAEAAGKKRKAIFEVFGHPEGE